MAIDITIGWPEIHERCGLPQLRRSGRHRRGECPFCGSHTGFSENDDLGVFHCFACCISGNKISFIESLLNTDFKGSLRWYGIEPGRPPTPDPHYQKAQRIRENLVKWKRRVGREARDSLLARNTIETWAIQYLKEDPESEIGWRLLGIALHGYARDEYVADRVDLADERNDQELFAVYQEFRGIL
jgi:hypothetical protein